MRLTLAIALLFATAKAAEYVVNQTTCGGTNYKYTGLAGYGSIPSNATDKYGDTIGGIGSSIAFNQSSWRKTGPDGYSGTVYATPDRGWNTNGTLNFQSRIHKFAITLKLAPDATPNNPSNPNVNLKYLDTILLTDPEGHPVTALDADATGHASFPGFPPLPVATYPGDGYGGPGPGGKRVSIDSEGTALDARDGGFWISDEYGPYIYKFNAQGRMVHAIQPPAAYLPRRNGTLSFNSNSPPLYSPQARPVPVYAESGRNNNQGLEGVTVSGDGNMLYALLQSSLNQEGGPEKLYRSPVRLLAYDVSNASDPVLAHDYAVMLPKYWDYTEKDASKAYGVASQSEVHQLPSGDFLVLSRDAGFGRGQKNTRSVYRHADIFSLKGKKPATDLRGEKNYDDAHGAMASSEGVLFPGIAPAEYCSFVDYNLNAELGKFRLHNGGPSDAFLLNEKWESLAVVPVDPSAGSYRAGQEYFLFSFSDNDFMTQDGHLNFGKFDYKDTSGYSLDTQVLAFKLKF